MKLPIVIVEGRDVGIFRTVGDAERKLEAIDVKKQIFKGYDAEGRRLHLSTYEDLRHWLFGMVCQSIELVAIESESEPTAQDELKEILTRYLADIGRPLENSHNKSLSELIQLAVSTSGYEK